MSNARELIIELNGELCRCGKTKASGQTFCRRCYFALPRPMRSALYRRVGAGYEAAYAAAANHLQHGDKDGDQTQS